MNKLTQQALLKFKLASDFHKRIRGNRANDDFGRTLTFLSFGRRLDQQVEITWKDLELIGELYDASENDTAV